MALADRMFSSVIVPVNGSPSSLRTVPTAMTLARQIGVTATIVRVVTSEEAVDEATLQISSVVPSSSADVAIEVLVGRSVETKLLGYLHGQSSALVVMATHARQAIGQLLLGSVADEIMQHNRAPVVMVGPNVEPLPNGERYEDLVACVDGTELGVRLVPLVEKSAADLGMTTLQFEATTPADHPVESIIDFAAHQRSPILAIATRGRRPAERLRQSSTTIGVLRSSRCPVMVVGPSVL